MSALRFDVDYTKCIVKCTFTKKFTKIYSGDYDDKLGLFDFNAFEISKKNNQPFVSFFYSPGEDELKIIRDLESKKYVKVVVYKVFTEFKCTYYPCTDELFNQILKNYRCSFDGKSLRVCIEDYRKIVDNYGMDGKKMYSICGTVNGKKVIRNQTNLNIPNYFENWTIYVRYGYIRTRQKSDEIPLGKSFYEVRTQSGEKYYYVEADPKYHFNNGKQTVQIYSLEEAEELKKSCSKWRMFEQYGRCSTNRPVHETLPDSIENYTIETGSHIQKRYRY